MRTYTRTARVLQTTPRARLRTQPPTTAMCPTAPNPTHDQSALLAKVLYTEKDIRNKVHELGAAISKDYAGRNPVVACVLTGGEWTFLMPPGHPTVYRGFHIPCDRPLLTPSADSAPQRPSFHPRESWDRILYFSGCGTCRHSEHEWTGERAAFMFTADLVREVTCPHVVDMIKVSSYEGTESSG